MIIKNVHYMSGLNVANIFSRDTEIALVCDIRLVSKFARFRSGNVL